VWDERSSFTVVTVIPSHPRITLQVISHCHHFRDLKRMFVGSRHTEQLILRSQPRIVVTVEDSVLRTEMNSLESEEQDDPK